MSPKKGTRESDDDHFEGDDGAEECTRSGCHRWTGLRDEQGQARCAQCELREKPTCGDCEVGAYEQTRSQTGDAVSVGYLRQKAAAAQR